MVVWAQPLGRSFFGEATVTYPTNVAVRMPAVRFGLRQKSDTPDPCQPIDYGLTRRERNG